MTLSLAERVASIPGAAQASFALELARISLEIWERYVQRPEDLSRINELVDQSHRISGGAEIIVQGILAEIVTEIEMVLRTQKDPKQDRLLNCFLATLMQPLTNGNWDGALPRPAALTFTAIFNLLAALLLRSSTPGGESKIYVAINHAWDAIVLEAIFTNDELQAMFEAHVRDFSDSSADSYDPLVDDSVQNGTVVDGQSPEDRFYTSFLNSFRREYRRCPRCCSTRIAEEPYGIEFTGLTCLSCGNGDVMDVWDLDEWYV